MTRRVLLLTAACLIAGGAALFIGLRPQGPPAAPSFVGTQACATCHQQAYDSWLQSDHRHAMEVADSHAVLGNFQDTTFDYAGIQSRFFTRDGRYFVTTDNARGELQTFPIAYTFGHYPLQQYLIAFPDGRLQALSISWDSRPAAQGGQRWYHLYPDEKVTHEDPLHWTGAFQNWNSRCASCHSTNLMRNYSMQGDRYDTHWQELNVGCEACHGPGSLHLAWAHGNGSLQNQGLTTQVAKEWQPHDGQLPIPQRADTPLSGQLQVCGGCHSRRGELQHPEVGANFFDDYNLSPLLEGRYFADGQMHEEVYELGSFLQSRMHANHVSCTNCHEPHSGHLRVSGNGLCLQCHQAQRFDTREHFFHQPGAPGSQCVDCHMPQHTYMGIDVRRDHSFRVPDPLASVRFGVPDACTQCHTNRSDQWAADFIAGRTGRSAPFYPQTRLLAAARRDDATVAPELLAYAADSTRPAMLRSIMLLESARFPSPAQVQAASAALTSPDPLLRTSAAFALAPLDLAQRLAHLQVLFADPVKSVRLAAARQLIDLPLAQAPAPQQAALGRLFDEYRQSLLYNADLPESMSDLGLFEAAQGNLDAAEKALLQARRLSPRYLPAMLNLADIYRARHRDDLGEPLLREAQAAYPQSSDVLHLLGLLYVRTGRTPQSVALFQRAAQLAPGNAQYAMVYAMALVETGQRDRGMQILQRATRRFPNDVALRQLLETYRSR